MQNVSDKILDKFKDAVEVCQKSGREYTHVKVADLAELLRRLDGERWVRVSERLPDNQGWYYIYPTPKEWSKPIWHGAWFANGRWWESGMPTARLYRGESSITHWMIPPSDPLSAPPSKPSLEDRRDCSLCGTVRAPLNREGTRRGACTFIGCKDPLHDYNLEHPGNQPREGGDATETENGSNPRTRSESATVASPEAVGKGGAGHADSSPLPGTPEAEAQYERSTLQCAENIKAAQAGGDTQTTEVPPIMVGKGCDREDVHPAWRAWRSGQPKSVLLRCGETENELTRAYDAIVKAQAEPAAASVEGGAASFWPIWLKKWTGEHPAFLPQQTIAIAFAEAYLAQSTPTAEELAQKMLSYLYPGVTVQGSDLDLSLKWARAALAALRGGKG